MPGDVVTFKGVDSTITYQPHQPHFSHQRSDEEWKRDAFSRETM